MARPQLTTLALPRSSTWPSNLIQPHQTPFYFLPDVAAFAKFMLATPASLVADLEEELNLLAVDKLERLESLIVGEELGVEFIDVASLKIQRDIEEVQRTMDVAEMREAITITRLEMERAARRAQESSVARAKFATASLDARPSEDIAPDAYISTAPATQVSKPKARKNVNPPPPSTQTYYYYQSATGLPIFLHPLDIRILLSHFLNYESFPDEIWVKVEGRDEGRVDDDLRKRRCKYLGGLAEGVDVVFLEVDWTATHAKDGISGIENVIAEGVLTTFEGAIKARRAKRKEREKKDERWSAKVEERERERTRNELMESRWLPSKAMPLDFHGIIDADEIQAIPVPEVPGAWGARSFASTLSAPTRSQPEVAGAVKRDEDWDQGVDAAWRELEEARKTAANKGAGARKKGGKIVLSINGGGGPSGRRR